ncbi:MAG: sulfur carrier protein ThiS [Oscillospiraceae bacterium]|nr:sulfur carrier protein ThiS [Oscillospiraceae bacterium]
MKINGKNELFEAITLLEYLTKHQYNPDYVVIERNREIIRKEQFGKIFLDDGDEINILHFMGGG